MILSSVRSAVGSALYAGFSSLQRDLASRRDPAFSAAWDTTSNIPGWLGETEAAAFWSVVDEVRPRTVVEIGSYLGRSTVLLGTALRAARVPDARLVAIDPHTGDRQHLERLGLEVLPSLELFRSHTTAAGLDDLLDVRVATSSEVAKEWGEPVDLLFVDGWHSYDAVVEDARSFASHLTARGLVCFDDYHRYPEVREAVDDVCRELGLTVYGTVLAQAWAGRAEEPPSRLAAALRLDRARRRLLPRA